MTEPMHLKPLGEGCACAVTHTPAAYVPHTHHVIPESWNGPTVPENLVEICPNTHTAVHRLINEYVRAKGDPGWEIRRQYGPYARSLAARAWANRPERPTYTIAHP